MNGTSGSDRRENWYRCFGKRCFDLACTMPLTVAMLPLLGATALAVRVTSKGPILFRQLRVGKDGSQFEVYKFRSMYENEVDPNTMGRVTSAHSLVTPVGKLIRRLKIDELPQLFNVLKGDLSLVGPRPMLPKMAAALSEEQGERMAVTPGMTGWAQVNGNTSLPWDERIALDIWYLHHQSLWLDLKILGKTVAVILFGEQPNEEALHEVGLRRSR